MLFLWQWRRGRRPGVDAELDAHMAGVQLGLDEKRARWSRFLLDKLAELHTQAQAQTAGGAAEALEARANG